MLELLDIVVVVVVLVSCFNRTMILAEHQSRV